MANEEQLALLKKSVAEWNEWREKNPDVEIDLIEANLRWADLNGANLCKAFLSMANFGGATMVQANLSKATLIEASFIETRLNGANLDGACLIEANLRRAHLSKASLINADLSKASLRRTNLYDADLREANLSKTYLSGANFSLAKLQNANLGEAMLVETNLEGANLTGCRIYGISAWNLNLKDAIQTNLIITPKEQATIEVDDIEVAQFIYLLLNRDKLRNVINSVTERGVLILGRFSDGGIKILQAIATQLRDLKYLPIIFDFDRPDARNLTETVKTLVGLSRFVIVDLSGSSVPQELYATVPHFKIPFVPIIEEGRKIQAMWPDISEYPWVLKPVLKFKNQQHLIDLLPLQIVAAAEERCKERQMELEQLFPRETESGMQKTN